MTSAASFALSPLAWCSVDDWLTERPCDTCRSPRAVCLRGGGGGAVRADFPEFPVVCVHTGCLLSLVPNTSVCGCVCEATVKAFYSLSDSLPATRAGVARRCVKAAMDSFTYSCVQRTK